MRRFSSALRRLLSIRNVAPIVIIFIAVSASLGVKPFGIQYSIDQVVLGLLALLAIDAMVERLDVLARIEEGVDSLKAAVHPAIPSDAFLKRRDIRQFETLLQDARSEFCVAGITLDTTATLVELMVARLRSGCRARILAIDPTGSALEHVARYFSSNPAFIAERIRSNIRLISSNFLRVPQGSFEIRVIDIPLLTGFAIADAAEPTGRMFVQHYAYWAGVGGSPLIELSRQKDKLWFPEYLLEFEKAWEHSTAYPLTPIPTAM